MLEAVKALCEYADFSTIVSSHQQSIENSTDSDIDSHVSVNYSLLRMLLLGYQPDCRLLN